MQAALEQAMIWGDEIPIGLFYEDTTRDALEDLEPVLQDGALGRKTGSRHYRGAGRINRQTDDVN